MAAARAQERCWTAIDLPARCGKAAARGTGAAEELSYLVPSHGPLDHRGIKCSKLIRDLLKLAVNAGKTDRNALFGVSKLPELLGGRIYFRTYSAYPNAN